VDDTAGGESDDIELSLSLCLGGHFSTDVKRQCLARSSSIASICSASSLDRDRDTDPSLLRTNSLPTETEEERAMVSTMARAGRHVEQMPHVVEAIHFWTLSLAMQNTLSGCIACWRLKFICTMLIVSYFCICMLLFESV
jgi:hypothetical protein